MKPFRQHNSLNVQRAQLNGKKAKFHSIMDVKALQQELKNLMELYVQLHI